MHDSSRIKKTFTETETSFEGEYKGYRIEIELEEIERFTGYDDAEPEHRFYIRVFNNEISFGTLYDGYAPEEIETMKEAKAEALRGSMLIEANQ